MHRVVTVILFWTSLSAADVRFAAPAYYCTGRTRTIVLNTLNDSLGLGDNEGPTQVSYLDKLWRAITPAFLYAVYRTPQELDHHRQRSYTTPRDHIGFLEVTEPNDSEKLLATAEVVANFPIKPTAGPGVYTKGILGLEANEILSDYLEKHFKRRVQFGKVWTDEKLGLGRASVAHHVLQAAVVLLRTLHRDAVDETELIVWCRGKETARQYEEIGFRPILHETIKSEFPDYEADPSTFLFHVSVLDFYGRFKGKVHAANLAYETKGHPFSPLSLRHRVSELSDLIATFTPFEQAVLSSAYLKRAQLLLSLRDFEGARKDLRRILLVESLNPSQDLLELQLQLDVRSFYDPVTRKGKVEDAIQFLLDPKTRINYQGLRPIEGAGDFIDYYLTWMYLESTQWKLADALLAKVAPTWKENIPSPLALGIVPTPLDIYGQSHSNIVAAGIADHLETDSGRYYSDEILAWVPSALSITFRRQRAKIFADAKDHESAARENKIADLLSQHFVVAK